MWVIIKNNYPSVSNGLLDVGGIYEVKYEGPDSYLVRLMVKGKGKEVSVNVSKDFCTPATPEQVMTMVTSKLNPGKVYKSNYDFKHPNTDGYDPNFISNLTKNIQVQMSKLGNEYGATSYGIVDHVNSDGTITVTFTMDGQKHVDNSTNKEGPEQGEEPLTRLELIDRE